MNRRNFISLAAVSGMAAASGGKLALANVTPTNPAGASPKGSQGRVLPVNRGIIRIRCIHHDATIQYAVEELGRYLHEMSGATTVFVPATAYVAEPETLWLGCTGDFPDLQLPAVDDAARDDAILIQAGNRRGIIAGTSPRAALIATYRYLGALGCRWVRPGPRGDFVPLVADPMAHEVQIVEKASYRHRGISIEGACSSENVNDIVDWMPKVGMNTGFLEYLDAYIYYNNWYAGRELPGNSDKLTPDRPISEIADSNVREMKKRGMLVHRMGHGWTCMFLGIPPALWDEPIKRDFGDLTRYIALYKGHRQLYHGIPRRTHLCYSQAYVRTKLAEELVNYAEKHPEVDYVHFWLADGANHCCECDECRKQRPADWYVMMLNEADRLLTERKLPTRIVFLAYADLLWPPEKQRLEHPDRFLLMFATLSRSYLEPFHPEGRRNPIPPFKLNELTFPPGQDLSFLAAWQQVFPGDSFIYDYRFMWSQYDDPGYMELAQATALDIPTLAQVGLHGMISDQSLRVFLPSGMPMETMTRKLWRDDLPYEDLARDYFAAAFGPDAVACQAYLEAISKHFDPHWLQYFVPAKGTLPPGSVQNLRPGQAVPPGTVERLQQCRRIIANFKPVIQRNRDLSDRCQALSWTYLALHAEICVLMSQALQSEVQGNQADAEAHWQRLERFVITREAECQRAFDVFLFLLSMKKKHRFGKPLAENVRLD